MSSCRFRSTIGVEWKSTCYALTRVSQSNWMGRTIWTARRRIAETAARTNCCRRTVTLCCAFSLKTWARISTWCWTRSNAPCSAVVIAILAASQADVQQSEQLAIAHAVARTWDEDLGPLQSVLNFSLDVTGELRFNAIGLVDGRMLF